MRLRVPARLAAALAVLIAAGLTACSSTPSASTTSAAGTDIPLLRVGLGQSLTTLNPAKDIYAAWVNVLSLEMLMKFGPTGKVEPDLASSVSHPNPVTYVYHLRHGVKFWDGSELTAADAAYSLNYDRAASSQIAFSYTSVKSITASGRYSVVVTLTHPDASWQYVPAEQTAPIFEEKFAQEHASSFGNQGTLLMGSGPWEVDSFDPTTGATLSANPHWWGGKVPIKRITFTFYANATSEALAMRAGEIDTAPDVSATKTFETTSGAPMLNAPSCGIAFFGMNVTTPPWNDVHVRRAVAYALNRQAIIAAHGGYAQPLYTMIPDSLLQAIASPAQIGALLKSLPLYQYNVAKAKQQMAESAYPHGVSTTILEYSDPTILNESQVIAAELGVIGIHVQVKAMAVNPWSAIESGPASKRMTTESSGGCSNPDPSSYYDFLGSQNLQVGSWNVADYAPPTVNSLMTAGVATNDPAARLAVYTKLLQVLQTDVPYVGLYTVDASMPLSSKFTESGGFNYWTSPLSTTGYPSFYLNLRPAS
jgi:peptide/nickel transport system substrate-binding protein